jgi:hypothetical protein
MRSYSGGDSRQIKAMDLQRGDVFRLHVYGRVISVTPVVLSTTPVGSRVKVKIELENHSGVEFTDQGCIVEFLCPANRVFHLYPPDWNSDDDGEPEPIEPSSPREREPA